jgi:hypothetical protein
MSEAMNQTFWDEQAQSFVDDLGVLLITLTHPQLLEPILAAASDVDIVSRGNTFIAWPMAPRLPTTGDKPKRGGLKIANISEDIGRLVRPLKGDIKLMFEIVERNAPDEVMYSHGGLKLSNVRTEGRFIMADVVGYGSHGLAFPKSSANPDYAPGTFVI